MPVITRLQVAIAIFTIALLGHANVTGKEGESYFGHMFTYEKAETYSSILGGKVFLLEPSGVDVFRDASWAILIEGEISPETARNVRTLLARSPGVRIVFFDSPGGDLFAGLELGRLLATVDVQAVVPFGSQCVSACALAFLGGKSRLILAQPGAFGFHRQYYIKGGKIEYGSWQRDVATIDSYLRQINFRGVPADEIVGTTQLVTYSDNRLQDRGIVTATRDNHRKRVESILEVTGATITEKYMTSCALLAQQFDCQRVISTFRFPMLLQYFSENKDVILTIDQMRTLRPIFQSVERNKDVAEINCRLMKEGYIKYLNARLNVLAESSPPEAVFESYRIAAQKAVDSCSTLRSTESMRKQQPR